jgi:hypothetical protein
VDGVYEFFLAVQVFSIANALELKAGWKFGLQFVQPENKEDAGGAEQCVDAIPSLKLSIAWQRRLI